MGTAVAYIRKSVVQKGVQTLSWEIQEAQVRALASQYGDTDLVVYSDWGRSGRGDRQHLRSGYREMVAEIEAGRVSAVYAYSLSRLSRSLLEYARLARICQDQGVRIRLAKEGELEVGTASGRLVVGMLALVAQMEAELAQERSRDMIRARKARGDRLGRQPYGSRPGENLDLVVRTYVDCRSAHAAARALNAAGLPTRQGGPWRAQTVKSVLQTSAPDLLPARREQGVRRSSDRILARLLRCHCGTTLTSTVNHAGIRYRCPTAPDIPGHGRSSVAESIVLPWVVEELSRVTPPDSELGLARDLRDRRASLEEDLRRNKVAYLARDIGDEEYLSTKKALDAELEALDAGGHVEVLEAPDAAIDDPEAFNAWARTFLRYVQLDEEMRPAPVQPPWILPAWRGELPAA